jgi:predicted nucleic acid-binding protein
MADTVKMTFTLDAGTAERIDRSAQRLAMSKSGGVREAIREYALRIGHLSAGREIDVVIAACAMCWDARLWTLHTRDFADIPGLELFRPAGARVGPASD